MIVEIEPTDFDELAAAQNGWDTRYRPLKREGFNGRIISLRTNAIQIDIEQFDTPMDDRRRRSGDWLELRSAFSAQQRLRLLW